VPINYSTVMHWPFPETVQRYSPKDTILYALGVGAATANPLAEEDLKYVFERKLAALPTMALTLAGSGSWLGNPATGVTLSKLLHGEQFLTIHKPLAPEGVLVGRERVDEVYDKGADKGAVLYMSREIREQASGDLVATVGMGFFLRADGGFGGSSEGQPKPHPVPEERAPDAVLDLMTRPEQAAIYRLSGDWNPMHIDPRAAGMAGFDKPILHGMCAYGVAGRAILKLLCGNDPARLRKLNVRFASPVYPGETLRTQVWRECAGRAAFRVRAVGRDAVVLNNGYAEYIE
jgi:acyl dehydratase